jgi:hypothetical protein
MTSQQKKIPLLPTEMTEVCVSHAVLVLGSDDEQ